MVSRYSQDTGSLEHDSLVEYIFRWMRDILEEKI